MGWLLLPAGGRLLSRLGLRLVGGRPVPVGGGERLLPAGGLLMPAGGLQLSRRGLRLVRGVAGTCGGAESGCCRRGDC